MDKIKVIGFDADDTLWVNEPYYRETEKEFFKLISGFVNEKEAFDTLFRVEMQNLSRYGYGIKSFILSMIETALKVSKGKIPTETIDEIINLGKGMIDKPVELLDGVQEVLKRLNGKYRLIIATKGDLLDQERKLHKSGLAGFFHHIEIMSEKKEENYSVLIKHLDIKPHEFLMIGNSLKSDIYPVLSLGGKAVYIPFHTTWVYEEVKEADNKARDYLELTSLKDIPGVNLL